ncbi:FAD-dependent monooxygenase [Catenuloplanes atrovinosus]|uniref:2-polyprenyl-6-methoxyphenol hydroxylase-like FAD-dependent oxidoreductase n=1 Tax=Catenuloplanes atrovinosus TaxID=137266 RepID=A0AAE4CD44_9ACTN|nr:FAD-dependent monooxygenase [Catenuloplanes atrovinosus]MDR7277155.1 2-polyprenyl-6-methoxyphenol hydroxylase-like FAD-dependent oxidoreductase [Catenuloplanes atrovinosus]
MTRHALISGASIAGPALAHQLAARGWRTTVVERAPGLREEGQNIDVKGAGREVARRMGIEEDIRAAGTTELGLRFVDEHGAALAEFPVGDDRVGTANREILRGELSRILHEHTRSGTDYRFGTQITAIDDHGDGVRVRLSNGEIVDADVVVLAEGLRSRTRAMAFPEARVHELGMYCAYLTVPRLADDDRWWNWHHALDTRAVHLRPDNLGTTRAVLSFLTPLRGLEELDRAQQVLVLRRTFADVGWAAPRILDVIQEAPFYFDAIGQARMPRWSNGRVALLGDAAFCASPIAGMSTSLALVGAYVLAGELAAADDPRAAMSRYETIVRPYVERAQRLMPGLPRFGNPGTRRERDMLIRFFRVVNSPVARRMGDLIGKRYGPPADAIDLPAYPEAATA